MADKRAIKVETLDRLAEGFQESRGITDKLTIEQMIELAKVPTASGDSKFAQVVDKSITEVTAEDLAGVTSIGGYAFYGQRKLEIVTIPDGVKGIGEYAFYSCENLKSVTIPNGITTLGAYTFYYCKNLQSIIIPNTVTRINRSAFSVSGLTSITIPTSVTYIEDSVFDSVLSLKEAYYEGDITAWLKIHFTGMSSNPICHAHGLYIKNTLGEYELLENLEIPDTITELKAHTLYRCESLKSVTIPNSVKKIGSGAFKRCHNLTSITIPNSVTEIGSYAFDDCDKLTSVRIGNGITSIYSNSFGTNSQLTDIYIDKPEGSIANAPWGATNATIHWNTPLPSEEV